jgi:hypothetical protein
MKKLLCLWIGLSSLVGCSEVFRDLKNTKDIKNIPATPDSAISWVQSGWSTGPTILNSGNPQFAHFEVRGTDNALLDLPSTEISVEATSSSGGSISAGAIERVSVGIYRVALTGVLAGNPVLVSASIRDRVVDSDPLSIEVQPGTLAALNLRTGSHASDELVNGRSLGDAENFKVFAHGQDAAGNALGLQTVTWSLSPHASAFLKNTSGTQVEVQVHRPDLSAFRVKAELSSPSLSVESGEFSIESVVRTKANLARWYRADAFGQDLADLTLLGTDGPPDLRAVDLSPHAHHATANGSARPSFRQETFGTFSSFFFCRDSNNAVFCPGEDTTRDRFRISSNTQSSNWPLTHEDSNYSSVTLFVVLKREESHSSALHVAAVQSVGQPHGLYFGFPNSTTVSFGINGLGGGTRVQPSLGVFSNEAELYIGVYDRGSGNSDGLLALFRNQNETPLAQLNSLNPQTVGNTSLFMNLGQSFQDNNGKLHIAEFILFARALSNTERCEVRQYLVKKYELGFEEDCSLEINH